uniref:Peptidase A1 domain-containing protein n=1 Tax=Strombidium inclinatum TaxID=197538 RepID=A0A7S3IVK7_9SPIT|mmetsp:Transcript_40665/g.62014  ORF Transcript_40665/g.62014 Transcript_40665/m.62014 type:complete len:366 (+) Transcript_40665:565-1662(+)
MNFLYMLKDQGLVDHLIVSLWVDSSDGNSLIKFGSWDKHGLKSGSELTVIRTTTQFSYDLRIESATLSGKSIFNDGKARLLNIDPQLPYLYLPSGDFNTYASALKEKFPDQVVCDDNSCKFENNCDQAKEDWGDFTLTLKDSQGSSPAFPIHEKQMLVPGPILGDTEVTCYAAVFKNGNGAIDSTWYIGEIWLKNYYTVFDQSPFDELGQSYLQIGVGPKNPVNLIGDIHYNTDSNYYWPEAESLDDSVTIPPHKNPYSTSAYTRRHKMREEGKFPNGKHSPNTGPWLAWMEDNKMLVFIGGASLIFFIITCVTCCCCMKKKRRIDSYMYKTYSMMRNDSPLKKDLNTTGDEEKLDDEDDNKGIQ